MKISQDSFKLSEGDSEKYLGLRILLRSPGNSIMRRNAEINGGIDICGPLKAKVKILFSFSKLSAKDDQKLCNRAKIMPMLAGRFV